MFGYGSNEQTDASFETKANHAGRETRGIFYKHGEKWEANTFSSLQLVIIVSVVENNISSPQPGWHKPMG